MASKAIRFTKAEMEAVKAALDLFGPDLGSKGQAGLEKLHAKMEAASAPKTDAPGLGWRRFAEICEEELGSRLALPPNPSPQWYSRISGKLKELGVTEEQAREVARFVAGWRRSAVGLEYLASRVPELLVSARGTGRAAVQSQGYSLEDE